MKLAMAEVYEVATFYHHFDVVKEGEAAPPALTVRVCDSHRVRAGRRAASCSQKLPAILGAGRARARTRPASAAASRRRSRWSARTRSPQRDRSSNDAAARSRRRRRRPRRPTPATSTTPRYRADGGYALLRQCIAGERDAEDVIDGDGGLRACAASAAPAFPAGRKWRIVRAEAGAAPDGGQHRRGRARHVQGPLLPRARSAPLPRRHADRRAGRSASTRSTSTCATSTTAAARSSKRELARAAGRPAVRAAARSICAAAPAPTSAAKSPR